MTFEEAIALMRSGATLRHDFHGYVGQYRITDDVLWRQNENLPKGNPYRD